MTVVWSIYDHTGAAYNLKGKEVRLYYTCERGRFEVDFEIQETNKVVWSFFGREQKVIGDYTLSLEIIESAGKRRISKDYCNAFTLVGKSCEEAALGNPNISEDGNIVLSSKLDVYKIQPIIPTVGSNSNWFVDGTDTGKPSTGKSAYEYAKEKGYEGTESEYAESLKLAPENSEKLAELSAEIDGNNKILVGIKKNTTLFLDQNIYPINLAKGDVSVRVLDTNGIVQNGGITIYIKNASGTTITSGAIFGDKEKTFTLTEDAAKVGFYSAASNCVESGEIVIIFTNNESLNYGLKVEVDELKNRKVNTSQIADRAVTIEKLQIATSVNLLNPNDANSLFGYYDAGTAIVQNASYNVSGFIPVKGDNVYQLLPSDAAGTKFARFITFYDANKAYISKIFSNVAEVVAPTNAVYMRVSYFTDTWVKAQVTEGTEPQPYEPYRLVISKDYLPTEKADLEYFFLPKNIYVASGRTIELYYSQILLNYQKYNIKAQCSIGASLERKFQIKGDDAHIGNYPLTIFVYDDNGNILKSASSTIHIIDASVSNMAILPIGDSLTNGKAWLAEVRNLSKQAISFVGTRKTGYGSDSAIRHEGRSGGSCKMYNTDNVPYTFVDNGYGGVGADAAAFDSSKSYAKGDFCKYGADVYVFTSAHSGAWNTSHVRNLTQSNPFWDWNNNKFSMNHYKSFYGINYDAIMIFLGTNGINLEPMTNENGALGIKTLVENIRKEDNTTPIIVVNTIYRSGQNGIGTQGNTDGYTAQSEFKFDADRKVMLLAKAVEDMIGDMENVYICPVGFTHDSEYNFGNVKKSVNPRLTDTSEVFELFPIESVHPQLEGYLQMADEMFSTICAL